MVTDWQSSADDGATEEFLLVRALNSRYVSGADSDFARATEW